MRVTVLTLPDAKQVLSAKIEKFREEDGML